MPVDDVVKSLPELRYCCPQGMLDNGITPDSFILWPRPLGSDFVGVPHLGDQALKLNAIVRAKLSVLAHMLQRRGNSIVLLDKCTSSDFGWVGRQNQVAMHTCDRCQYLVFVDILLNQALEQILQL